MSKGYNKHGWTEIQKPAIGDSWAGGFGCHKDAITNDGLWNSSIKEYVVITPPKNDQERKMRALGGPSRVKELVREVTSEFTSLQLGTRPEVTPQLQEPATPLPPKEMSADSDR